ncbi:7SK snRNA methylphosphate capping enzyme-like [Biomphalaria glabrata]|uniref:RNA methyltransferase n=1 Tax=Biomphalaria glabrata TaxID=6526 RepID=A0A9U8ECV0_BIOGL|nr:7SK snRNA methylphosphate capping enzyme-like [Biomphalaria glabrata]
MDVVVAESSNTSEVITAIFADEEKKTDADSYNTGNNNGVVFDNHEEKLSDVNIFTKPYSPYHDMKEDSQIVVDNKQCSSSNSDAENKDKDDKEYESEPASLVNSEAQRKFKSKGFQGKQGKTIYPRPRSTSKEMRELSRKHAQLEKNLKIEGLPDPPKFRKRRLSLSSNMGRPHDKDVPFKRKRLASMDQRPKKDHMPKWELMGGDARDPLNLNGLAHSEEGRLLNLKTPESSPLPTPDFRKIVYVKVPPNIEDPLNLEGKHDQKVIDMLLNATIKKRHRSKKKKHDDTQQANISITNATDTELSETVCDAESDINAHDDTVSPKQTPQPVEELTPKKSKPDEIPTPTLSTKSSASSKGRSRSRSISMSPDRKFKRQISGGKGKATANEPTKFPKKPMFTLGNYNRYYGYRNRDQEPDPRLQYFNPTWFKDKDVLDIGCNVGHITLALAEQFYPHKILGMDIDGKLIQAARQNIRHMLSLRRKDSSKYPRVFEMTKGPLEAHPLMGSSDQFPNNILFLQGNYVPGSEEILKLQKEEYDTILALSITKWIHLNNGDAGLKLFFQKVFRQLRPGGRLILEPQPWSTYRKRAKLSPEMFATYQSIKLKPEAFKHYLLSIGFVKCEVIGVPITKAKGFRRPLILFTKPDNRQTPSVSTTEEIDYRDVCQECGSTNKAECDHPQFTGMRRGPYASHMYDHINYPTNASSDSPYFTLQRTCTSASFTYNNIDERGSNVPSADRSESMDDTNEFSVSNFTSDSWKRVRSSELDCKFSSSSRSDISGSEISCSSSSTSGSSSSGSSSSSSYYSPEPSGPNGINASDVEYSPALNGAIAVPSPGPNNDIAVSSPIFHGANGDIAIPSPSFHEPNGAIAGGGHIMANWANGEHSDPPILNNNSDSYSPQFNSPHGDAGPEDWVDVNNDASGAAAASEEMAEVPLEEDAENNDMGQAERSPNVYEVNGTDNVVQHWDHDNQDANIDAPLGNGNSHG